jgi:hypothetical protein
MQSLLIPSSSGIQPASCEMLCMDHKLIVSTLEPPFKGSFRIRGIDRLLGVVEMKL